MRCQIRCRFYFIKTFLKKHKFTPTSYIGGIFMSKKEKVPKTHEKADFILYFAILGQLLCLL